MSEKCGILLASDEHQEWLLPWWWEHYHKNNSSPVAIVNLGLSWKAELWCEERMKIIELEDQESFSSDSVSTDQKESWSKEIQVDTESDAFWNTRSKWFSKPFAIQASPFETTLWIDTDCEVKGEISSLFKKASHPSGFAIAGDPLSESITSEPHSIYNSGVIAVSKHSQVLSTWADAARKEHQHFRGDQDLLSALIARHNFEVGEIPIEYNCPANYLEICRNPIVIHWFGIYKKKVLKQILYKNFDLHQQ